MSGELDILARVRLADVADRCCGNCGCTFGQLYPGRDSRDVCERAIVVTDFRTDVLCRRCRCSYKWHREDWRQVNPEHYVRIPR